MTTPDAPGSDTPALRFVVHQHDATAMHYDFRLEAEDAVLKSWAVPKGPSMSPADRRLAMRTSDHQLSYIDFEGVLDGEGAGPVIVWDEGTYDNRTHAKRDKTELIPLADGVDHGHISFTLHGHKLEGGFSLTRTAKEPRERWIMIKRRDESADSDGPPVVTHRKSVQSGRTIEEVAAQG